MSQVIEPSSTGIISNDESKCATCGSSKFEGSDGLFFCIDCGTQSQVSQLILSCLYRNLDNISCADFC